MLSLGNGLSSVEAWYSTALDIEEVLSETGGDRLHVMVADVIKSFDTVDRSILDCALGRLGLPDWFRRAYFSFHSQVVDITHQHSTTFTAVFSTSVVVSVCVRFRFPDTQCCTDRTFIFGSRKRIASHGSGAQDSDGRRKP